MFKTGILFGVGFAIGSSAVGIALNVVLMLAGMAAG